MKIIPHRPDLQQEYKNEFKENNIYPFNKIGRVIINKDTGEIKHWCNELDSNLDTEGNPINLDPNTEDVMVHIPAFYCKRTWNGDVLTDSILNKVPTTPTLYGGYQVHPAFLRPDNTIRPYILVGAFLASEKNSQLRSVPNISPKTALLLSHSRDKARQGRGISFNIMDITTLSCIQMLYKVAFQNLNSQLVVGSGYHGKERISNTGNTMSLGNRSGIDSDTNTISVFGIEDLYGNIWQYIDGIYFYNNKISVISNPEFFGQIEKYEEIELTTQFPSGIAKSVYNISGNDKYKQLNIFSATTGTSNENDKYYCDIYTPVSLESGGLYLISNRYMDTHSGLSTSRILNNMNGNTWTDLGCRLCYLP